MRKQRLHLFLVVSIPNSKHSCHSRRWWIGCHRRLQICPWEAAQEQGNLFPFGSPCFWTGLASRARCRSSLYPLPSPKQAAVSNSGKARTNPSYPSKNQDCHTTGHHASKQAQEDVRKLALFRKQEHRTKRKAQKEIELKEEEAHTYLIRVTVWLQIDLKQQTTKESTRSWGRNNKGLGLVQDQQNNKERRKSKAHAVALENKREKATEQKARKHQNPHVGT